MPIDPPPFFPLRILVVDDEANIRMTLSMCLTAEGHHTVAVSSIDEALRSAAVEAFDLIFLDLRLGMDNGLDYIAPLLDQNPWTRIIVITAYASVETAVEAMKRGASDYLPKPFEAAQVLLVTQNVAERRQLERRIESLQSTMKNEDVELGMESAAAAMRAATELARQVATSRANLIIRGEFGTETGVLARAIHRWSNRAAEPCAVASCRCEAIDAFEAELFGVPAGASDQKPTAKAEFCHGGTLILEDINELPLRLQPMMLRLIKDREYERPDDPTRRRSDVRVIATTTSNLQKAVETGTFREDLLLSLNIVQIEIPPLRERTSDIMPLAERYLASLGRANERRALGFTDDATYVLRRHRWPGNALELRNVVERAVLICKDELVGVDHLPANLLNSPANVTVGDLVPLADVERLHIRRVVNSTRSLRQAATILGLDSGTVVRRLRRYGTNDDHAEA